MEELKPCPFCGGEAAFYGVDRYYVACCRCEARTAWYRTAQEAAVTWNRRAAPENKPLTLEQLRQMDDYPQPIWIELLNIAKPISCELITSISEDGIHTMAESGRDYAAFSLYGKTWLAYARKPEGDKP